MRAMHYRGLKQAARRCLRDSHTPYRRLTLLFLLCFLGLSLLCDLISFYLELRLAKEKLGEKNVYDMNHSIDQ